MTQADAFVVPTSVQTGGSRSIGLCLIVKNEAQIIAHCLDSVKPLVDFILIEDTGSTDGTQQIIAAWLRREAIPGRVIEEPWQNFAYNRSHALQQLRTTENVDYALIMDADDRLVLHDGFDPAVCKAALDHDLYDIEIRHGDNRFYRPQLCANRQPFCFKGVLHEYLEAPPGPFSRATAQGFHIQTGTGGVRSRNPRKYQDDAAVLARTLQTETDPFLISRYTFYLAQSYRDCNEREKALECYLRRAGQGYWAEEVFESLYAAATLQEELEFPADEVIATYIRASATVPTRAEALHGASRFCRLQGRNQEGFRFAQQGSDIPLPSGGLFVRSWIYEYGVLDELAINGYWSGHYRASLDACLRLLEGTTLPADQRERVARNARFALDKLPHEAQLGSLGQSSLVSQHALTPARPLRSQVSGEPKILLEMLAGQTAEVLPLYLDCIDALDYPKSSIVLRIHASGLDGAEPVLRDWLARVGPLYGDVEFATDETAEGLAAPDPAATKFHAVGRLHNASLRRAQEQGCAFCFVVDVTNFIRPCTLRELVALNLPIVAPLLRSVEAGRYYSNYHAEVDAAGYYENCDQYMWLLNRWVRGIIEVPVVQTTYLIRADVIPGLTYTDTTGRHDYVVFSESARHAGVIQYLDNRQVYGYIASGDVSNQQATDGVNHARALLEAEVPVRTIRSSQTASPVAPLITPVRDTARAAVCACFGLHSSGSTWMFNLVREVCAQAALPFVSVHCDWKSNLPWDKAGQSLIVAKSHSPDAEFRAHVAGSSDPALITVRDPRDALVSLMQRFPNGGGADFEKALKPLAWSAECLVSVARSCNVPVFRYEDGFVGTAATFDRVASLLGVTLPPDKRDGILAGLAPEAVRATIARLEAAGTIQGDDVWDAETQWHANHVGDGRVGKWRDVLTDQQAREITNRTAEYCRLFGYEIDIGEQRNAATRLRSRSVINILRPGAIGDVLMTGAVTAQLAARHPGAEIHYYTKVPEMAELLADVDKVRDADLWGQRTPGTDFNLIGYPLDQGYPERPMAKHLTTYFCDEAGLPPGLPQLRNLEPFEIRQQSWITVQPKAGWSVYKEWPIDHWNEVLRRFCQAYPEVAVVQLGGSDDPALQEMDYDLRGRTTISQALWLLKNSVLHLGVDSFTNHAAGAFRHPAVILFGSTSPTGSGYDTAVNLWAGLPCAPCYRENPRLSRQSRGPCINPPDQVYEQPNHACMQAITVEMVWQAIMGLMPTEDQGSNLPAPCRSHYTHDIGCVQTS